VWKKKVSTWKKENAVSGKKVDTGSSERGGGGRILRQGGNRTRPSAKKISSGEKLMKAGKKKRYF